jgi:hypothetical protein
MVMRGQGRPDVFVAWTNAQHILAGRHERYKMYLCGAQDTSQAPGRRTTVQQLCSAAGVPYPGTTGKPWTERLMLVQAITVNGLHYPAGTHLAQVRWDVNAVSKTCFLAGFNTNASDSKSVWWPS